MKKQNSMIKVGSDFSGVGAFDQALIRLGIEHETVFACDMDKYARQTYILNYGQPKYYPENVYDREIPKESLDVYMTSPPCQAFSLAGKRKGESDARGILFYNSHEFIKKNKPRFFIFENVKGLLSDNNGNTFQNWIYLLGGKSVNGNVVIFSHDDSVPYHVYYQVMNAKHYGVPQNRERVFIIGIRDDEDNDFSFPRPYHLEKRLKDVLESEVDEKYFLSNKMIDCLYGRVNISKGFEFKPTKGDKIANSVICKAGQYSTDNFIKVSKEVRTEESKVKRRQTGTNDFRGKEIEFRKQECSNTITTCLTNDHYIKYKEKIRRLTPAECFRLMDFNEDFKWNVSDTQAYKQAGNSIVVNCLVEIIKKLPL